MSPKTSLGNLQSQSPASTSSRAHALRNEEKAYEQFEQKLVRWITNQRSPILIKLPTYLPCHIIALVTRIVGPVHAGRTWHVSPIKPSWKNKLMLLQ
jgi:hypothetical protein